MDFQEVTAGRVRAPIPEGRKRKNSDSSSDGFDDTLSDWDIDEEEVAKATEGKSFVRYEAPASKKKAPKPAVAAAQGYEEESYYDEEEDDAEEPVEVKPEPPKPAPKKEYNLRPRPPKDNQEKPKGKPAA